MIDYVLTAAVGISAGVGALVSAIPGLQQHTLAICLSILLIVTGVNLRGVREAAVAFMIPTYLFVGCLFIMIGAGAVKALAAGGHPVPVEPMPQMPPATAAVSLWLLLKVFSNRCTAMTGVKAVSNGVKAFREPTAPNAQRTHHHHRHPDGAAGRHCFTCLGHHPWVCSPPHRLQISIGGGSRRVSWVHFCAARRNP